MPRASAFHSRHLSGPGERMPLPETRPEAAARHCGRAERFSVDGLLYSSRRGVVWVDGFGQHRDERLARWRDPPAAQLEHQRTHAVEIKGTSLREKAFYFPP